MILWHPLLKKMNFMTLWILELVSHFSVLSWWISFQFVEKPAEIKLVIISDNLRNFIDGMRKLWKKSSGWNKCRREVFMKD
jgi:hypothetical protein